jgi:thiol peroxidase
MEALTVSTTNAEERTGEISMKGDPLTLLGPRPMPGRSAPDFALLRTDGSAVTQEDYRGRTVILNTVPSLDTSVCDRQAQRFNAEAADLPGTAVLVVSMDLPFAQKRWCGANAADNIETLSDHRTGQFGLDYGLLIKENRLLARAVLVIDPSGTLRHVQIVPELAEEPDYDAALEAAREASS